MTTSYSYIYTIYQIGNIFRLKISGGGGEGTPAPLLYQPFVLQKPSRALLDLYLLDGSGRACHFCDPDLRTRLDRRKGRRLGGNP